MTRHQFISAPTGPQAGPDLPAPASGLAQLVELAGLPAMRAGLGHRLLEALSLEALAFPAALGLGLRLLQARDQPVSGRLQLAERRQVRLRSQRARRPFGGTPLGVGREARLQAGDLPAQRRTGSALVLRRRRLGVLRRLRLAERLARRAPGVESPRQLARIDPLRERVGATWAASSSSVGATETYGATNVPQSLPGDREPVVLQAPVDAPCRVDVDAGAGREFAHARQLLPRRQPAALDQRLQPPGEVDPDGKIVGPGELGEVLVLRPVCH